VGVMRALAGEVPSFNTRRSDHILAETLKKELSTLAMEVVNQPLRELNIGETNGVGKLFLRTRWKRK